MNAQKITIFLILLCVIAITSVAVIVNVQMNQLSNEFSLDLRKAFSVLPESKIDPGDLSRKQDELRSQMSKVINEIKYLRDSPDINAAQEAAKKILDRIRYGRDGYVYVYDIAQPGQAVCIVHPYKQHFVGHDKWTLKVHGQFVIQDLVKTVKEQPGGGFMQYWWEAPSTTLTTKKYGYVVEIPEWRWLIGVGIYLHDLEGALIGLSESSLRAAKVKSLNIGITVTTAVLLLGFASWMLYQKQQDDLTHRHALALSDQSEELATLLHGRLRSALIVVQQNLELVLRQLSSDIQDTVLGTRLPASKVTIRAIIEQSGEHIRYATRFVKAFTPEVNAMMAAEQNLQVLLQSAPQNVQEMVIVTGSESNGSLRGLLSESAEYLRKARKYIREDVPKMMEKIAAPPLLDKTSPGALINKMQSCAEKFRQLSENDGRDISAQVVVPVNVHTGLSLNRTGVLGGLVDEIFLNIATHDKSISRVILSLEQASRYLSIRISDDGEGFNLQDVHYGIGAGRGLRDMQRHAASLGGVLLRVQAPRSNEWVITVPLI
jgi:signal transduction histidine kinase